MISEEALMKTKLITLITAAIMLAAVMLLSSCESSNYYEELDEKGYTVSVTYDPNGGTFTSSDAVITDVFNPSLYTADGNGNIHISLTDPESPDRSKGDPLKLSNPEHFLAGWYTERTPIDENDLSKGYTYSGKWDFETDKLALDKNGEYTSAESQLTLYAAWIPYYTYEFYADDGNGGFTRLDDPEKPFKAITLQIPEWGEGDVTLDMKNFYQRSGYTLVNAYLDENMQTPLSGSITGQWDEETAVSLTPTVKVYTTWREGTWYKIHTADELRKNANVNGCYEILADLDFTGVDWPGAFSNSKFSGKIEGNGHTISNVSVESTNRSRVNNGLFSAITEKAEISNISFTGITHTINLALVSPDSKYALFAGTVYPGAVFENVTVSGKILFGDKCADIAGGTNYTVSLLTGDGAVAGISAGTITAEKVNPENSSFEIVIDGDGVTLARPNN